MISMKYPKVNGAKRQYYDRGYKASGRHKRSEGDIMQKVVMNLDALEGMNTILEAHYDYRRWFDENDADDRDRILANPASIGTCSVGGFGR